MASYLVSWIGFADINAAKDAPSENFGPVGQALRWKAFDRAVFLLDAETGKGRDVVEPFLAELTNGATEFEFRETDLDPPTDYRAIYQIASAIFEDLSDEIDRNEVTVHISPGTPAMQAIWILLAKTRYPVQLIQSSIQQGVQPVEIPFDIHAEYIPELIRVQGERVKAATTNPLIAAPGFEDIVCRSQSMRRVIDRARRVAEYNVPVLIEGESGTGKEMMANAICKASPREGSPIPVNCGAIPKELVESQLFGHIKGAFTGAIEDKEGFFDRANGGTLFLDEVGDLPLEAQMRLLRVLQEDEVQPVGAVEPHKVDVRIISATNRDLRDELRRGNFREDLYYRLAVTTLDLPPLRERAGDLTPLIDHLLTAAAAKLGIKEKKLTPGARNALEAHSWPGNVRELQHTLTRALLWSDGKQITERDAKESIPYVPTRATDEILTRPLGDGFDLDEVLDGVAESYINRALTEAGRNTTQAAGLLGFSQQKLSYQIKKFDLK